MISILWLLLIGAVAGYAASRIMRVDMNPLATVGIGVVGALIGGSLLKAFLPLLGSLVGALLGACILIWLVRQVALKR